MTPTPPDRRRLSASTAEGPAVPGLRVRFLIGHAFGRGGRIRTTLNLASILADRGHDVEVVSLLQRRAVPFFPLAPSVPLRTLTSTRALPASKRGRLRRLVSRPLRVALSRRRSRLFRPSDSWYPHTSRWTDLTVRRWFEQQRDGVVVATDPALTRLMVDLAPPGVVTVAAEHLNLLRSGSAVRGALDRYHRLDGVVCLTEADAVDYRGLVADSVRVVCIPNAVPPTPTGPPVATPGAPPMPPERPIVVAAGRLRRQKGFDQLIEAWRMVGPTHPDWQLRIYGEGPQRGRLETLIRRHGLAGSVRLMGFDPHWNATLAGCDIFVLSSRYEGFPMVLLEAMALGAAVVATDCPTGPSELILDGMNGVLVPPDDQTSLAVAIRGLIEDPERRTRLGQAARDVTARYDRNAIAEQWETFLAGLRNDESAVCSPP